MPVSQNGAMTDDAPGPSGLPDLHDPHVLGPGLLPTPFTADEIRVACGSGRTMRLLVEEPDGERFQRISRFRDCDDEGATLERWRVAADGGVEGEVSSGRITWHELQEHAAFPADRTTVSTETLELPIGRLQCLRYDTRVAEPTDAPVATFWFARTHQGMPVYREEPTPAGVQRATMVEVEAVP